MAPSFAGGMVGRGTCRPHHSRPIAVRSPNVRPTGDALVTECTAGHCPPAMDRRRFDHRVLLAGAGRAPDVGLDLHLPPCTRSATSPRCRVGAARGRGGKGPSPAGGRSWLSSCRARCVQPSRIASPLPGSVSMRRGPALLLAEAVCRALGRIPPQLDSARTSATSFPLAVEARPRAAAPRSLSVSVRAFGQGHASSARPSPLDALSIQQPSACSCVLGRAAVLTTVSASSLGGHDAWRRHEAGAVMSSTGVQATQPHMRREKRSGGPLSHVTPEMSVPGFRSAEGAANTPTLTPAWAPTPSPSRPRHDQPLHCKGDGHRRGGGTSHNEVA